MIEKKEKFKRALLWVPSKLYELALRLRIAAYETEYLKQKRLDATVISIGNITLGGTGKSPMVAYVARYLKEEGHAVAILTRGYGRKSSGMRVLNDPRRAASDDNLQNNSRVAAHTYHEYGDEPLMLARALPQIPVIINEDRHEGGAWAISELGAEVLILDDAYQHLALARDLNILLIDATDSFGSFEVVPFGRLREPLYGIKRADAVIITRADKPFDQGQTNAILKYFCGEKVPVMYVYSTIARLRHLASGDAYDTSEFVGWNAAIMCGIGNPHAFADDVLHTGMNIVAEDFFPDHYSFTQEDIERITRSARSVGADAIVTTEKDAVRLESINHGEVPIYVAELEIESDDEVRLKSLLLRTIIKK